MKCTKTIDKAIEFRTYFRRAATDGIWTMYRIPAEEILVDVVDVITPASDPT